MPWHKTVQFFGNKTDGISSPPKTCDATEQMGISGKIRAVKSQKKIHGVQMLLKGLLACGVWFAWIRRFHVQCHIISYLET